MYNLPYIFIHCSVKCAIHVYKKEMLQQTTFLCIKSYLLFNVTCFNIFMLLFLRLFFANILLYDITEINFILLFVHCCKHSCKHIETYMQEYSISAKFECPKYMLALSYVFYHQ